MNTLRRKAEKFEQENKWTDAIDCYSTILDVSKNDTATFCSISSSMATCLHKIGKDEEAIHHFQNILHYHTNVAGVYDNLCLLYSHRRQYKHALDSILCSFKLSQNDSVYKNMADLYYYMKEYKKSIFFYGKVTTNPQTLYNTSFPYLASKQFLKGFAMYENRLNNSIGPDGNSTRLELPQIPYWDGTSEFTSMLIIYEQGLGDNIQYFRFLLQLSEMFPDKEFTYLCRQELSHLFKNYPNIVVIDDSKPVNLYQQYKIYIMSLPYHLKLDTITPFKRNYIHSNEGHDHPWVLKNDTCRIGIFYKGRLTSFIEKSLHLESFRPISELEDVQLISLHRPHEINQDLESLSSSMDITVLDIDKGKAFEDTKELLRKIDLVITVDTSITHLAGVIGIPTLLLLGYGSDWRWFDDNEKVWYDSVEILRMTENIPLDNIMPRVLERVEEWKREWKKMKNGAKRA